jgi:hypothetical protein
LLFGLLSSYCINDVTIIVVLHNDRKRYHSAMWNRIPWPRLPLPWNAMPLGAMTMTTLRITIIQIATAATVNAMAVHAHEAADRCRVMIHEATNTMASDRIAMATTMTMEVSISMRIRCEANICKVSHKFQLHSGVSSCNDGPVQLFIGADCTAAIASYCRALVELIGVAS